MRILLPPSEAKTGGGRRGAARPVDPRLAAAREQVAAALATALADPADAVARLALPATSAAADLTHNATIGASPRRPALDRYAGVVYAGLDAVTLDPAARRRANTAVLVFSGLFGVLRGDEPVPRYRVPAAAALPGVGVLATFWKPVLTAVLPTLLHGLVVDLRSTDYAAMWKAPASAVRVTVLSPRPSGPPKVVSYDSKLGKGRLARALVEAPRPARTVDDVAAAWLAAGGRDATVTAAGLDLLV